MSRPEQLSPAGGDSFITSCLWKVGPAPNALGSSSLVCMHASSTVT